MNLLLLGRGKTGSLVEQVARERGHHVAILPSAENPRGTGLTEARLNGVDAVIDFTNPEAVLPNIEACARAGVSMVVGTTGWYADLARVQDLVAHAQIGFVYASNFSIGVNLFFDIVRAASVAARHGYGARIVERHHIHKKDKPSGTAISIAQRYTGGVASPSTIPIESLREGEIVGEHTLILESAADTITLQHNAKSRRGFAEGAVTAAEWIKGKQGFYEFQQVLKLL